MKLNLPKAVDGDALFEALTSRVFGPSHPLAHIASSIAPTPTTTTWALFPGGTGRDVVKSCVFDFDDPWQFLPAR